MLNEKIKQKIIHGDIKRVAEITGVTPLTVSNHLHGYGEMRIDILEAFVSIIEKREAKREKLLKKL